MYALYARQSRDKKDSISIESQFDFCSKEVPEGKEVKKYKDKGFSGKNIERPDFQKLLDDIKKGKIEKVIVYRLDRMSRSTLDFAQLMDVFKKYSVEFVSTTERFDTSTPIGKAMLSIIMVFAELERNTIMQRITDNYYQRGKKGMHLGGGVPYGFDLKPFKIDGVNTNMYEPNKDAEIVSRIFDLYSNSNLALGRIAKDFNWEGIKTPNDSDWTNNAVRRTIMSPAYVKANVDVYNYYKNQGCIIHNDIEQFIGVNGLYLYGKGDKHQNLDGYNIVIAPHEGIIDSKTWLKSQYKLSKNKQIKNSGKSKYSWLSGLVKCSKCGYAMCVNKANLSVKYNTFATYFRCSKRTLKMTCDAKSVYVSDVETEVEKRMLDYIEALDSKLKVDKAQETKKANELKMQIANRENEIENLVDNLASAKGVAMKYINKRLEKLDSELSDLREEYKKESQTDSLDDSKIIEFKEVIKYWSKMDIDEKKEIAKALIDKVLVDGDIINIVWNY